MNNDLLTAVIKHFDAEKLRAKANLDVYLQNSVGVGEHSDLVEEIITWTRKYEEAEGCIKVLDKHFVGK